MLFYNDKVENLLQEKSEVDSWLVVGDGKEYSDSQLTIGGIPEISIRKEKRHRRNRH